MKRIIIVSFTQETFFSFLLSNSYFSYLSLREIVKKTTIVEVKAFITNIIHSDLFDLTSNKMAILL